MNSASLEAQPRGARVLVADDNEINRELLTAVLEAAGHSVECAFDGGQALAMATAGDFDLLVLDLHMPVLEGREVLRQLRADPRTAELTVMVLSADAMRGTAEEVLVAGADEFMTKPFELPHLRETVSRLLG